MNDQDPVGKMFDTSLVENVKIVCVNHIQEKSDDTERLAWVLMDRAFLQEWFVYDGPKDVKALDRLSAAIQEIESILDCRHLTDAAQMSLQQRIALGPHMEEVEKGKTRFMDIETKAYIKEIGGPISITLDAIGEHGLAIRNAIAATRNEIVHSDSTRKSTMRMNLIGIQLVEASRFVWKLAIGKDAPAGDLNPATAFGKFLTDIFDACEVSSDPRSAFRAWAKETST